MMADALILLVVFTIVGFSCAVGYMIWYIRRNMETRMLDDATADLRESFSPRQAHMCFWSPVAVDICPDNVLIVCVCVCVCFRAAGLEHRIDVVTR